ncbi:NAD-dependent epimerase/dehydratase, N-terminal domain [Lasallia pustulata]|uniref:NAD-dependent epimerase/dehydratase, N-terminal domain n=1 Tax=Lasallia pustulata TaxID=136370 RepID=A0A1W5DB13_9LECA|nr:NAD-dependent epimerase/dehydratase, N-terminal domain [Lasallia pustulata]
MAQTAENQTSPSTSSPTADKPAVLIIGGLGYIGRFLALHIHRHSLASTVLLVDKVLPQLAWLAPEFTAACSPSNFVQADASREASLAKLFDRPAGQQWDYVFNCAGETRYSQDESVYKLRSLQLTQVLGRECARRRVRAFVEFGTGMVYKPPGRGAGCAEEAPTKPWLKIAKYKLLAEEALEALAREEGLRYVVLRLAHVYGEYDVGFLARGLCLARVYESQGREMKWLWGKELRVHTVHVEDVCRAAWRAAEWCAGGESGGKEAGGRVFNIVDRGNTTQGTLARLFSATFPSLTTGFQNSLISTFARFNLDSVVDDVNEEILQPWADLLAAKGIVRPGPISPFMEKELLRDSDLALNGARFERVCGFEYTRTLGEEECRQVVESYRRMGWWP